MDSKNNQQPLNYRQLLGDNKEVVRIILSGNNTEKAALNNCFLQLFAKLFGKLSFNTGGLVKKGSIEESYAEEAFNDMLEVFFTKVKKGTFDPEGASLPVFLYVIFYRKYIKIRHREGSGPGNNMSENDRPAPSPVSQSLLDIPGRTEHILDEAIALCSEACKPVLIAIFKRGLRLKQIALELGLSEQTVRNRSAECGSRLRKIIITMNRKNNAV